MKRIVRQSSALAGGLLATVLLSFAALAQTPSDSAAKQANMDPAIYLKAMLAAGPRNDRVVPQKGTYVDFLDGQGNRPRRDAIDRSTLFRPLKWNPLPPNPATDVREINLEGLRKILQREPNDKRPLLLNFWATWCDPCREEFPDLVKLDGDYKNKDLNFIAVSLDDITDLKSEVPKFLNQMKATMPVVLLNVNDPEPAIKLVDATWDGQLPATFLYNHDGKIVFKHFGKIKPDELRAAIDREIRK